MISVNERCPLQSECDRKCNFKFKENECPYYIGNARPGCEIRGFEVEEPENFWLDDEEENNRLVYLPTSKIYPHPDNPRKDVGDVTELADSIKESGILQNLTVVPYENGYRVIIGHRRLAASKLIGLAEVPCAVVDMDYKTQVATMLAENMQRVDLTVPEQVYGIQLMLDLGETIDEIQKKTGFSKSTVRHRIKMAELPKDKFQESVSRGATLEQYIKLEQIKDPKLKAKVLDAAGTTDFNFKFNNAIEEEKQAALRKEWIDLYSTFATEIDIKTEDGYERISREYIFDRDTLANFEKPDDADTTEYFFCFGKEYWGKSYIKLLKLKSEPTDEELREKEEKKRAAEELEGRKNKLKEVFTVIYNLRKSFVQNFAEDKEALKILQYEWLKFALKKTYYFRFDVIETVKFLSLNFEDGMTNTAITEDERFKEYYEKHPCRMLLAIMFIFLDRPDINCFDYYATYRKNEELEKWYELLCKLGYQMSDAEKKLIKGKDELYVKE